MAAATYAFFYGVEFSLSSLAPMYVTNVLQYLGIVTMPVLLFIFAARYSGNDRWLKRSHVVLLFVVPAFTVTMVLTNSIHHLYYSSVSVGVSNDFSFLKLEHGPLWWLHTFYSYAFFATGLVLLTRVFFAVSRTDRPRVGYLLASALLVFALNVAYIVGLRPYGFLDLTPAGFAVMGVMLARGVYTQKIFDIKPVALDVLFDGVPDVVLVLDAKGTVVNANPAARVLLASTVIRQQLEGTVKARDGAATDAIPREPSDGEVVTGERTFLRSDTELLSRGGSRLGTLIVLRDITERKRAAQRLQHSRDRYRSLVNNIPGATYQRALDAHRTMRYMSAGIEAITGYPPADFVDGAVRAYESVIHPEDGERVDRTIGAAVEQVNPWELEYRILHRDGGVRWVYERGMATNDPERNEPSLNGFIMDVTQQKRDRVEIEQSHRELRRLATHLQAVREQERAAVAWELHDEIGQSLAVVKTNLAGYDRLLSAGEQSQLRPNLRQTAGILDEAITRLRRLYTGLRPGMLDDLGLSATIDWQTAEFARESGIDCRMARLDEVILTNDPCSLAVYRVFQGVLYTIVRNSGATRAEVTVERQDHHVVVRVSDNGCAISEDDLPPDVALEYTAMRERLRDCQGTLSIRALEAGGKVTEIRVPVQ
jgi:PAS domain S-box-containing protein